MTITQDTVKRIGKLARLEIAEQDLPRVQENLQNIVSWVEQLKEVNTDEVEPLFNIHLDAMPQQEDVISDGGYVNKILQNAPAKDLNMFEVPKVVE